MVACPCTEDHRFSSGLSFPMISSSFSALASEIACHDIGGNSDTSLATASSVLREPKILMFVVFSPRLSVKGPRRCRSA